MLYVLEDELLKLKDEGIISKNLLIQLKLYENMLDRLTIKDI